MTVPGNKGDDVVRDLAQFTGQPTRRVRRHLRRQPGAGWRFLLRHLVNLACVLVGVVIGLLLGAVQYVR